MSVAVTKLWDKFTATPEEKLKRLGDQIKRIDDLINKRIKDLNSYNTAQSVIEKYNELDTNTRLRRRPKMQEYLDAVNKEFNRSFKFIDNNLIVDTSENDYKEVHNQNQLKNLQDKNRKLNNSLDIQIKELDYTFDKSKILSTKFQNYLDNLDNFEMLKNISGNQIPNQSFSKALLSKALLKDFTDPASWYKPINMFPGSGNMSMFPGYKQIGLYQYEHRNIKLDLLDFLHKQMVPYIDQIIHLSNYLKDIGRLGPETNLHDVYKYISNLNQSEFKELVENAIISDSFFYGNNTEERDKFQKDFENNVKEQRDNAKLIDNYQKINYANIDEYSDDISKTLVNPSIKSNDKSYYNWKPGNVLNPVMLNDFKRDIQTLLSLRNTILPSLEEQFQNSSSFADFLKNNNNISLLKNNFDVLKSFYQDKDPNNPLFSKLQNIAKPLENLIEFQKKYDDYVKLFPNKNILNASDEELAKIGLSRDNLNFFKNPENLYNAFKNNLGSGLQVFEALETDLENKINVFKQDEQQYNKVGNASINEFYQKQKNEAWINENKDSTDITKKFAKALVDELKFITDYKTAEDFTNSILNTSDNLLNPLQLKIKKEVFPKFKMAEALKETKLDFVSLLGFDKWDFQNVKTNELAARGGFANSVVNNSDNVFWRIYDTMQKMAQEIRKNSTIH